MRLNAKTCPVCGDPVIGRADKKFCSDHCRATFNHDYRAAVNESIIDMNRTLRNNRNILQSLCPEGKAVVRKEVLVEKGYDFNCFSSVYLTSNQTLYYICYDYAFSPIINNNREKALIVSVQDHMTHGNPWTFHQRIQSQSK